MIRRVYEQCKKSTSLSKVVVATDDDRLLSEVKNFGGEVFLTSDKHPSGTDRCNEVAQMLLTMGEHFDVVVNIQGDEPYIAPSQIDLLCSCFNDSQVEIATLAKRIENPEEIFNPSVNKVILDNFDNAIYFSRNPIPFNQNVEKDKWAENYDFLKHIGIYAYKTKVLGKITQLKPSSLEKAESLEQLRWLQNGIKIRVKETDIESVSVDTPDDLSKIANMY